MQNSLPLKAWKRLMTWILDRKEAKMDRAICGRSLVKYAKDSTEDVKASQPAHYLLLEHVFKKVQLTDSDVFLDVGCGKGRVLAFLLNKGFKGRLCGVELKADVAAVAQGWSKNFPNVEVMVDSVLDIPLSDYTFFSLFNPFGEEVLRKFVEKVEREVAHPARLVYISDQATGFVLEGRPNWTLKKRGWLWKHGMYYLAFSPQRCSYWEYQPSES